ncbi:phage/plasmid primase, P4 family [Streptomyces smyrnaeus]|uniref:DNA primase family protein n=1 Tax=Streptomyces smyrnaeus TaxID=1387713 RepID=UPI0037B89B40
MDADEIAARAGVPVERHGGQLRFAERLVARYRGRLLYVHGIGWHVWDGCRWALDKDGAAVRAVAETLKAAFPELSGLDEESRKSLLRDIGKCESASGTDGVLRLASCLEEVAVAADRMNPDPFLFNTPGGTYDLRTGTLRPADPEDLITKVSGADPSGDAPNFMAFIARVLPDKEVREFVQRLLGSALSGVVRDHLLPIFNGEGANGKSTLENAVREAVGEYGINIDPKMLLTQRFDAHTTERMDLMGARLVFAHETNKGRELDAAVVKALTGGDAIRARRMRQDPVEFTPTHTLVMVTNHLPNVSADDPALWRRLVVVPFDVVIPEAERDTSLADVLRLELGGITAWLLEGYRKYEMEGPNPPASVQLATDDYKSSADALGRFIEEHCEVGQCLTEMSSAISKGYREWCLAAGEPTMPDKDLKIAMERRGFEWARTNTGRIYRGVAVKPPPTPEGFQDR